MYWSVAPCPRAQTMKFAMPLLPFMQVTLRHKLEIFVLSDQRNKLELEIHQLVAEQNCRVTVGSSAWNAMQRAAQLLQIVDYEILLRKLLLRNQEANPQQGHASVHDPVLHHQANTLFSEKKKATKVGRPDPTQIEYPGLDMDMDLHKVRPLLTACCIHAICQVPPKCNEVLDLHIPHCRQGIDGAQVA